MDPTRTGHVNTTQPPASGGRFVRLAELTRPGLRLYIDGREVEALEGDCQD